MDGKNLTTVGSSNLPVAGPNASVGDVASFDDQSTEAHTTGQRKKSSNKTIVDAFEDIRAMADSLALPKSIADRAKYIFKDVYDGKLLKGRSMHLIASACLHIACRCVIFYTVIYQLLLFIILFIPNFLMYYFCLSLKARRSSAKFQRGLCCQQRYSKRN